MNIPIKSFPDGLSLPILGLGTWRMGGDAKKNPDNNDHTDIHAIRTAIDHGITHIDTAELYAQGHAETLLGHAIKGYDRSSLFLVSKVLSHHLSPLDIRTSLMNTLKRINTSYIDMYMIHFPSDTVPIKETMEEMNRLADAGYIRHIAVSNFRLSRLKEAQSYSRRRIGAVQVHYNLIYREPEYAGLLSFCQEHNIAMIAWRPLEKGMLVKHPAPILSKMSEKYHKTPAQIALNWLISQHNVVTIVKMTSPSHLQENLGAIGWNIEHEDIEILRKEFPGQQEISRAVPLS